MPMLLHIDWGEAANPRPVLTSARTMLVSIPNGQGLEGLLSGPTRMGVAGLNFGSIGTN